MRFMVHEVHRFMGSSVYGFKARERTAERVQLDTSRVPAEASLSLHLNSEPDEPMNPMNLVNPMNPLNP